jgi:hypothetical protein
MCAGPGRGSRPSLSWRHGWWCPGHLSEYLAASTKQQLFRLFHPNARSCQQKGFRMIRIRRTAWLATATVALEAPPGYPSGQAAGRGARPLRQSAAIAESSNTKSM